MSFSLDTKNELSRIEPEKKCCMLAEISGFIRVAGSISLAGLGKYNIKVITENPATARHYKKLLQDYFSIETTLEYGQGYSVQRSSKDRKVSYIINIDPANKSEQILRECGILLVKEGYNYISDGIYDGIVKSKCCRKAYLRGAFLGCGTMSNPEKSYDLEFVVSSETLANNIKKLIGTFVDLSAKVIKRGSKYVVYMKKADYISDTLAIMGASSQVFALEEIRIKKGFVNSAKRVVNCDNANTDRSINAAMRQVEAIRRIAEGTGLKNLTPELFEIASLRLENPEISISALGELCNPPLTKSGVNNRLKKLEQIANQYMN